LNSPTQAPVHVLHSHTVFSILDGAGTIDQYLDYCQKNGLSACACTDHGYVLGLYDLISKSNKAGIKPIPGLEVYLKPADWYEFKHKPFNYFHLTLWAKNQEGYKNIMSLATRSWTQGRVVTIFGHPRPCITWDDLSLFRQGLIVGSGCIEGPIAKPLIRGEDEMAIRGAQELLNLFGDDLFFEIMPHRVTNNYVKDELIQVKNAEGVTFTFSPEDKLQTDEGLITAKQAMEKKVGFIEGADPLRAWDQPLIETGKEVSRNLDLGGCE
jgi:DNA polymerase III alpha subunit